MKRVAISSLIAVMLLASGLWAETQGTFRGKVVHAPQGERSPGLLYLRGADGNVRRVVVVKAAVVYDPAVPSADRVRSPRRALVPGAEVRVTALVDSKSGEWTASRVEVIANHSADFDDDYSDGDDESDQVAAPREIIRTGRTI